MLPAVSAEDCLFADLGIDPGDGCQAYEATSFLMQRHPIDPTAHLLLWQVGTIGNWTYESTGYDLRTFPSLVAKLQQFYSPAHPVTVYEASFDPRGRARAATNATRASARFARYSRHYAARTAFTCAVVAWVESQRAAKCVGLCVPHTRQRPQLSE